MSPASPTDTEPALFDYAITAGGKPIDSRFQVESVDTWTAVNRVPRARIVLYDGSPAEETFPISSSDTFLPGTTIQISAGYAGKPKTIFSGIVVAHGIEISRDTASRLVVDGADPAIKMTISRKTAVFEQLTDSALIGQLIEATAGLTKEVAETKTVHEAVFQHHATDWDTMLLRAEMNGLVVTTHAGRITVKAPDTSQAPLLKVGYGESMLDLRAEMDAVRQLPTSAIKSYAWDSKSQTLLEAAAGNVPFTEAGNVKSATLSTVCGVRAFTDVTGAPVAQDDLVSWSSAVLLRSRLAKIRGRVRFQGSALAKPGTTLELAGVGDRFNGQVFVSAVHHDIRHNRWFTTAEFGLASDWFADTASVAAPAAAGQLPPIRGLQTGKVKQITKDPEEGYRVLVSLPIAQDDSKGVWARLSSFYASAGFGAAFYPEVGDEVVVGFMNEDPRFPVILGSLYSSRRAPAPGFEPNDDNSPKGLVTKSKMEVSFDETKKIITIKTPGLHVIALDDEKGAITITDSSSNSVTLDKNGIALDSKSKIAISATGDIAITAGGNLSMKATANATCEGAQAELKGSGTVTVQGSLVKIN